MLEGPLQRLTGDHVLPFAPERFFELYFSEEYREHQRARQRLREMTVLRDEMVGGTRHFELRVHPDREFPAAVRKVLPKASAAFVEKRKWVPGSNRVEWTVIPEAVGDRAEVGGTLRVEPHAQGCRRIVDGSITVRIFGVGGMIEKAVARNVQAGFDDAAALLRELA